MDYENRTELPNRCANDSIPHLSTVDEEIKIVGKEAVQDGSNDDCIHRMEEEIDDIACHYPEELEERFFVSLNAGE